MPKQKESHSPVTVLVVVLIVLFFAMSIDIAPYGTLKKQDAAKARIIIFKHAIKKYNIDTGRYPSEDEGLHVLTKTPDGVLINGMVGYLEGGIVPLDPWKNEYVYEITNDPQRPYDVYSYGADGKPGGEGENADIYDFDQEFAQQ